MSKRLSRQNSTIKVRKCEEKRPEFYKKHTNFSDLIRKRQELCAENAKKVAANRTPSKLDARPIANCKTDVPNFLIHILKLVIALKICVADPLKVSWSELVSIKKAVFDPLIFWEKHSFHTLWPPPPPAWYTSLESYGSHLSDCLALVDCPTRWSLWYWYWDFYVDHLVGGRGPI